MGIIFIDGFEDGTLNKWTLSSGATSLSSAGLDMSGSYVCECTGASDYLRKTFSSALTELYITFRYRISAIHASANHAVCTFKDNAGTLIARLAYNRATNVLYLTRGTTSIAVGTHTFVAGQTQLIKVRYKPLNSGGVFTVWLNDFVTEEVTFSGDTTDGLENIGSFALALDGSVLASQAYFDDCVISTTDIIQNLRIASLAITGAGTTTEWDPSTGSNYQNIDEVGTPDDTNYNSTNTVNEVDTFTLADPTTSIASIAAVELSVRCRYTGTVTPKHLQTTVHTHSANYASGTDIHPPISFDTFQQVWETNPNTGIAWTEAELIALEAGYKAIT